MNFLSNIKFKFPFLLFLLFLPHFMYAICNHEIWAWDQAWYGEESFRAWNTLTHFPLIYFQTLVHQFGMKAPLIAWMGQWLCPLAYLFHEPALILILIPIVGVISCSIFWLAFTSNRSAALTSILFLVSMPLFFGLQGQYFVEPIQFLSVSILIYLVYRKEHFSFWSLFFLSLLAFSIGVCAKISTPLYQFLWCTLIIWELFKKQKAEIGGVFLPLPMQWP